MAKILDDLSKNLAGGMTRRRALTAFGASVVGAAAFWNKTGQAEAVGYCFNFSSDPCVNFCNDLYGGGVIGDSTSVYDECLNRCQPLANVNAFEAARTQCPANTAPILIGQHAPLRTPSNPEYNPFPQQLARPYIVCAPLGLNDSSLSTSRVTR